MIDLHMHSTHSDGTYTPKQLVRMSKDKNIRVISITDHDTCSGTHEAIEAGSELGVTVISGLELSVSHGELYFHLLGYGFDWKEGGLHSGLKKLQESRRERNDRIWAKLHDMGIVITKEELDEQAVEGQIGRPHFARLLVKKGLVKNLDKAFKHYLRKGACAYVKRFTYSAESAIKLIHGAGGLAVLAHPVQLGYSVEKLRPLIRELKSFGLDGIETHYPTQKGKIRKKLSEISRQFELLETGGSDYHGDIRPSTSMADGRDLTVPYEFYEKLSASLRLMKN